MAEGVIPVRLWHKDLIPLLPRQQLLGQWRECCLIAKQIAEKGTPNHVLVNRIMEYGSEHFWYYTMDVAFEMTKRGYKGNVESFLKHYRKYGEAFPRYIKSENLFPGWHNDRYLRQCLANLQEKFDAGAIQKDEWQQITDHFPEYK